MAPSPNDLYDYLDQLLSRAVEVLDEIPTYPETADLEGAPDARYITPGLPTWDCCPALIAYASLTQDAQTSPLTTVLDPAHKGLSFPRMPVPTLNLLALRCVPVIAEGATEIVFPSPTELAASARQINADGWALWIRLNQMIKANDLFTGRCGDVFFDSIVSQDPAGGCGGWLLSIRVGLGGFRTAV